MSKRTRALLIALASMLMIAAAGGIASAGRLSVTEREFEWSWPEANRFTIRYGGREIACPLTLTSLLENRVMVKTIGGRIAVLREIRQRAENCVGGGRMFVGEPIREVRFAGFEGTLPSITGIRVTIPGMGVQVREFIECRYEMPAATPLRGTLARNVATGRLTTFTVTGTYTNPEPVLCPNATFSGAGAITVTGAATVITMTLI